MIGGGEGAGQPLPAVTTRAAMLERLERETFDLAIIGGGITGAGIARDAALRGLSVALVEQGDFASGTSSRSSRLIHGGLRYLRYGHLGLVREGLHERGLLLRLAPHLVRPLAFVMPVWEDSRDGTLLLRLGLTGYDVLAGTLGIGRHRGLSRERLLEAEPSLRSEGLKSGFRYFDATTDDARLTLSVALSAARAGAVALNYAKAVGLERTGERVTGINFRDAAGDAEGTVRARVVVSAAGPWTDQLRETLGQRAILRPTKGVHLVVRRERLPVNAAVAFYYGERLLFAVPHGEHTYIGTTDTDWRGDPGSVETEAEDVEYVLEAANASFSTGLEVGDIVGAWAGLRPLLADEGTPSEVSRDYDILDGPPGLYTICGGKLTSFRAMAEHIVSQVVEREGERFSVRPRRSRTARAPLPGATADFKSYRRSAVAALGGGWGMTEEEANRLVDTYGTEHVRALAPAARDTALLEPLAEGSPVLAVEAVNAAEQEMAVTLEDFMRRRTDLMLFGEGGSLDAAAAAARHMGRALGWDGEETERQLASYLEAVSRMMAFRQG